MAHEPGDDDSAIVSVVDQIVRHAVLAALPNHDAGGMKIDLANVVDVVVENQIVAIDVLGSRAVAAQQDASAAQVLNMVAGDSVFLPMQIHADRAAAAVAKVASLDRAILDSGNPAPYNLERVTTYPFTEDRRSETAVFRAPSGEFTVASKGAPETIMSRCDMDDAEKEKWIEQVRQLAETGHKVIACAWQELPRDGWSGTEPVQGYRFAGLLGCEDSVREGVVEAVRQAQHAGIFIYTRDSPVPRTLAGPVRLGFARQREAGPAPALGEHTDAVLRELGLTDAQIGALRAGGVVG